MADRPQNIWQVLAGAAGTGLSHVGANYAAGKQQEKQNAMQMMAATMEIQEAEQAQALHKMRMTQGRTSLKEANARMARALEDQNLEAQGYADKVNRQHQLDILNMSQEQRYANRDAEIARHNRAAEAETTRYHDINAANQDNISVAQDRMLAQDAQKKRVEQLGGFMNLALAERDRDKFDDLVETGMLPSYNPATLRLALPEFGELIPRAMLDSLAKLDSLYYAPVTNFMGGTKKKTAPSTDDEELRSLLKKAGVGD